MNILFLFEFFLKLEIDNKKTIKRRIHSGIMLIGQELGRPTNENSKNSMLK